MKRILLSLSIFFLFAKSFAQPITVNTTTYTVPQLVQDVLFGNGTAGSACVGTINNITWSTGSNFGSHNGIGYFTNTNPNFPLTNGVILSTGRIDQIPGPNTQQLGGFGDQIWPGDNQLFNYINGLGIDPDLDDYNDATILEFDFTPLTDQMSFDFLFASEEYGTYQCTFSDAFAFFLTNTTAGTPAVNLALVPGTVTETPISVTTIRDNSNLPTCDAANPAFFGSNNEGAAAAAAAAIDFNGQTVLMTANATVIPGNTYHIKLVIADRNDQSFDSAVFLGGGSFNIGSADLAGTGIYDGLTDLTIANGSGICDDIAITIQAGVVALPGVTYQWTLDTNIIPGANTNSYTITQGGDYGITITYPGGCQQSDTMTVEYFPPLSLGTPSNITQCSQPFDVTVDEVTILNGNVGTVSYHYTLSGAKTYSDYIANPNSYDGSNGQEIFVAVEDATNGCISTTSFFVIEDVALCTPPVTPGTPPNLTEFELTLGGGIGDFDFTPQLPFVYGSYNLSDYTVTFYTSPTDANNGVNPINPINSFLGTVSQIIYVRLEDNANPSIFGITSFILFVSPLPNATITQSTTICSGQDATITFQGTPNATVTYNVNGGTNLSTILNSSGQSIISSGILTSTTVYDLVSVQDPNDPTVIVPLTGSITITVNTAPVITTPTTFVVCDESLNNDGIYCFDLTQKDLEVSTDPNVVITYHETSTDAQTGSNPLTGLYCNINPGSQDIFVRASFTGSSACYSTTQFQLIINPLPLPNPVITDYELCDYNSSGDEQEVFVLNTKTAEIANGQTGVTVTYYETQADAQNQVNSLPNNYTNTSNPQQIWINISDNATGCNTVGSFNLVVNPLPLTAVPLPIFQCSNGAVTTATFDLTVNESVTTAGATGMIVSYYNTLVDAQTPSNVIPTPLAYLGSDNETIYVRVENSATGCYSVTTQLLRVTQGPVAITPTPLERCDPNNDGFEVFDLTLATNQIAGGSVPPGVTVTYHETPTDALLGSNPILGLYPNIEPNQQTIYVKVFYTTTGCSNYVELKLIVNPTPEATEPLDYHLCDYTGAVGYESFDLTSKIAEILGSINAATHTVTFYIDLPQAQLGTGNITNVTAYINGTIDQETLYVRVETNATGCYDIVTLDLIVDPLPNSTQPSYAQYSLCDYDQSKIGYEIFDLSSKEADILLGQTGMSVTFYPSRIDALNDTNAITSSNYENAIIYVQTLGIRITNDATGCYVVSTMDIRVEPLPEPIPPTTPYTICDDNQDGFANFILSTLEADILGGEVYTITFHETLTNAQQGTNPLSTTAYTNINPFVQILYVRAENPVTGCFSVMPITLEVNPSPIAPIDLDDIEVCDTNANNQNGQMTVDLTIRTADVLAQQPLPASSYTVTYYTSQLQAEQGNLPIIPATNYLASNLETIWVRVENNATGCYNLGSFQVLVGIPLVVPTPQPINECDTLPNDQFAVFDLTVRQITALPGYTFQYYPSWTDAQNDTNQITNITSYTNVSPAVQTLGVRIISAQGCVGYTTLNIRVLPAPEPNTNPNVLPAVCEGATTPGQAQVDLTQNEAYILNGDPNLTVEYYPTLADLENNTNQIINPASALVGDATLVDDPINLVQYVYIAVSGNNTIDYTGRRCYTVVPQGYVINPLPKVDIIGTSNVYQICESDPTGNDNIEVFDLTSQIPDLLEGNVTTPISTYSVAFYETATGSPITNPSAYTNTSNPQTIYVVITNTNAAATTMCPSLVGSFTLQVNPKPVFAIDITTDLNYETCDENDGINDGQTLHSGLPLSDYIDDILGTTQSPTDYTVTFHYNSQSDAEAGLNAIQDLATYQVQTGTYWVRIENNLTGCYITDSFNVIVEQLAEPNIVATTNIACVNFGETTVNNTLILDSQVTGNYTFEWYADGNLIPGENGPTLTVTEVTDAQVEFSVIAISNTALQCTSDTTPDRTRFTVIRSGLASNLTYTVTNAFSDLQIITVSYDGYGVYHFSLDDGPILDNGGVFTNVPIGTHTVHVWDVRDPNGYSCGEVSIEGVQIIDYPHYFTPNGDGYHDTWNIKGLENFADATKIYIFDRHGKLLKQISSDGDGWDGTYNGQLMPSTDYWFKVEYPEAGVMKEFKAHFSLKR